MLYVPLSSSCPGETDFSRWVLRVAITVRSPKHEEVLRREWDEAQKTGIDWSKVVFEKT